MLQKLKNRQSQAGFTLVELLIVIVIIAILATIGIVAFSGAQADARDTQRKADIDQVQQLLEVYFAEEGNYPSEATVKGTPYSDGTFEGVGVDTFHAPGNDTAGNSFVGSEADVASEYGYEALPASCDEDDSTTAGVCTSYTLSWYSEAEDKAKTEASIGGS